MDYLKIAIFILLVINQSFAQNLVQKKETAQKVFDKLVLAYGNIKTEPLLLILPNNKTERVVAAYTSQPRPTIKVDEKLIDICLTLKEDSLNALACILGHELAHYYNDHTFCNDYSFVNKNKEFQKTLNKESYNNKKEKETQADFQGLWYASMAGYKTLGTFETIINQVYLKYNLPENMPGYPSKAERKELNNSVKTKIGKLIPIFDAGYILNQMGNFDDAIYCFDYILQFFPSKDNYNNAGLARLAKVITSKPLESIPFVYPLQIDANSLLRNNFKNSGTKGYDVETEKMNLLLLKQAKSLFEKAINGEPNYVEANLNLAILNSLNKNQEAAIGILNNLAESNNKNTNSLLIKAIAYYKLGDESNSEKYFGHLKNSTDLLIKHNIKLFELSKGPKTLLNKYLISLKKENGEQNINQPDFPKQLLNCQTLKSEFVLCSDRNNENLNIQIGKQKFYCTKRYSYYGSQIIIDKFAVIPVFNNQAWFVSLLN